jgi:DNA-binding CsgD family transcriptional regulator
MLTGASSADLDLTLSRLTRALRLAQEQLKEATTFSATLAQLRRRSLDVVEIMPCTAALTPSERRVALMAAQGRTNREIAGELCLSVYTVKSHVRGILGKLGLQSRWQLQDQPWVSAVAKATLGPPSRRQRTQPAWESVHHRAMNGPVDTEIGSLERTPPEPVLRP